MTVDPASVEIFYRNHRGETAWRSILPIRIWFGSTAFHPIPQWLLEARDLERGKMRDFAVADIAEWIGTPPKEQST